MNIVKNSKKTPRSTLQSEHRPWHFDLPERFLFLFFLFFFLVDIQNRFNRLLSDQIFLHLFLDLTVLRIGLFFLNQEPVKLLMQNLTGRNLFSIQLVKGLS